MYHLSNFESTMFSYNGGEPDYSRDFMERLEKEDKIHQAAAELAAIEEERTAKKEAEAEMVKTQWAEANEIEQHHAKLRKIKEEYLAYKKMAEAEEKAARMAMRKIQIAKKRMAEIEKGSWKLAMKLGLTDSDYYPGLGY